MVGEAPIVRFPDPDPESIRPWPRSVAKHYDHHLRGNNAPYELGERRIGRRQRARLFAETVISKIERHGPDFRQACTSHGNPDAKGHTDGAGGLDARATFSRANSPSTSCLSSPPRFRGYAPVPLPPDQRGSTYVGSSTLRRAASWGARRQMPRARSLGADLGHLHRHGVLLLMSPRSDAHHHTAPATTVLWSPPKRLARRQEWAGA